MGGGHLVLIFRNSNLPSVCGHLRLICKLYDDMAFPETAEEKAEWEVVDEKSGNLVHLPRQAIHWPLWCLLSFPNGSLRPFPL